MTDQLWRAPDQSTAICPVCGDFKGVYDDYCCGCEEWKRNADNRRKAEKRRRAFGSFL